MTLAEALIVVWQQVLAENRKEVTLGEESWPVGKTRSRKLRMVEFEFGDRRFDGIEQNPEKSSRWALEARKGKRIMQFSCDGRYVANVCEGRLTRYPIWHDLRLG